MYKYLLLLTLIPFGWAHEPFAPANRLAALGVARGDLTTELLAKRTELMIESQTFAILRDPRAVPGAAKIMSPGMQKFFEDAERKSGLPASLISAIAFLESFGETTAQSPTGPKGVMQISSGTAQSMGLKMIYGTHYKTGTEKRVVKTKGKKTVTRTVKVRIPYKVLVRDERLVPERAIPAAAVYLARLDRKFGGLDWAVFAYHCGEGCVGSMRGLTEGSKGIKAPYTVAKMFFSATPAMNRDLYLAVRREMERDYSPTYWFRIMRAERLLMLYRDNPAEFKSLAEQYRYEPDPTQRAPHRLALWLRTRDLRYQNFADVKRSEGKDLVRVFDDPERFGFKSMLTDEEELQASPAAVGTLVYIAFETRRMFEAMKPREAWVPLTVTSLVRPAEFVGTQPESLAHSSGQVFDIDLRSLPLAEREALDFILNDMGWEGYLGFVEESPNSGTMHIGCSPSSRIFFTGVFEEALQAGGHASGSNGSAARVKLSVP